MAKWVELGGEGYVINEALSSLIIVIPWPMSLSEG